MMKTFTKEVTVTKSEQLRCSDFSETPIPQLHSSAVTNIWCMVSDHGNKSGNKVMEFDLELKPEEMNEFREELGRLISRLKAKYRQRNTGEKR